MLKFKVALLGINSLFGQISSLLLKQSNFIKRLILYDEHNIDSAKDISVINTSCKVEAYKGRDQLNDAVKDADIIIIGDDNFSTPHTAFDLMAPKICDYARVIASTSPNAIVVIAASPINVLVPLFSEALIDCGCYDCNKVIGATCVDSIRASCILASHMKVNPQKVTVPVIGGASRETRVPLFSQAKPSIQLPQDVMKQLTADIKRSEMEIFSMKKTPEALNKAYTTIRFLNSILLGLRGEQDVINIAFSRTAQVPGIEYFSLPVQFGRFGIMKRFGIPKIHPVENELIDESVYYLSKDIELANNYYKNRETAQEIGIHGNAVSEKQYVKPLFDRLKINETTDLDKDKTITVNKSRKIGDNVSACINNASIHLDVSANNRQEIIVKPWDKPFDTRAFWLKHTNYLPENKLDKTESKKLPSTININDSIIFRKENTPSKPDKELPRHRSVSSLTSLEDPGEPIPQYSSKTLLMDTILKKTIEKTKAEQISQEVLTNLATGKKNECSKEVKNKTFQNLKSYKVLDISKDNFISKTETNNARDTIENIPDPPKNSSIAKYPLNSLSFSFSDKVKKILRKHKNEPNTKEPEYIKIKDNAEPKEKYQDSVTLFKKSNIPPPVFTELNNFKKDSSPIYTLLKQDQQNVETNKRNSPCSTFDSLTTDSTKLRIDTDKEGMIKKDGFSKNQIIENEEPLKEIILKKESIDNRNGDYTKGQMVQKTPFAKDQVIEKNKTVKNHVFQKYESRKDQLVVADESILKRQTFQKNESAEYETENIKTLQTNIKDGILSMRDHNKDSSPEEISNTPNNREMISSKSESTNENELPRGSLENNKTLLFVNCPNNFFINYNKHREESISYLKSRKIHYDKPSIEEDEKYFSEMSPAEIDFHDDPVVHLIEVLDKDVYSDNFIESLNEPTNCNSGERKTNSELEDLSNKQLLDKNNSVILESFNNKEENFKSSFDSKFNIKQNNPDMAGIGQNREQIPDDKSIFQNTSYIPVSDAVNLKKNIVSRPNNSKLGFLDSKTSDCVPQSQANSWSTFGPAIIEESKGNYRDTSPLHLTSKNRYLAKIDQASAGFTSSNYFDRSSIRNNATTMNLNRIRGILLTNIKNKSYNEQKTNLKYNQNSKNTVKSIEETRHSNVKNMNKINEFIQKDGVTVQNVFSTSGIPVQAKKGSEIINSAHQSDHNSLKIPKIVNNVNKSPYKVSDSQIKDQPNILFDSIVFSHNKLFSITNPKSIKFSSENINENAGSRKHLSCLPMINPLSNLKSGINVEKNHTPRRFARYSTTTQLRNKSPSRVYVDKLKTKLIKSSNQSHMKYLINTKKSINKRITIPKKPQNLLNVLQQKFHADNNSNKTSVKHIPLTKINSCGYFIEDNKPPNTRNLPPLITNVFCDESTHKTVRGAFIERIMGLMPSKHLKSHTGVENTSKHRQTVPVPKISPKYATKDGAGNSGVHSNSQGANACSQILKKRYHHLSKAFPKSDGRQEMKNYINVQSKLCENFMESNGLSNIYSSYIKDFVEFKFPKKHRTSFIYT